jgi:hypothetical protein
VEADPANSILVWLYGATLIGSISLIFGLVSAARAEWRAERDREPHFLAEQFEAIGVKPPAWIWTHAGRLRHNTMFMFALFFLLQSIALIFVSLIRIHDAFVGKNIAGDWPWLLVAAIALLASAKAGFTWTATLSHRSKRLWWKFVACQAAWAAAMAVILSR